jgi:hypothetical protein
VPLTRWSGRTTTKQPGKAQKKSSAPPIAKQIDLFAAEGDVGLATAQDFGVVEQTSCGVFVLAMEDEFEQVRLAAISSIRQLGLSSLPFATEAVMHLIGTCEIVNLFYK